MGGFGGTPNFSFSTAVIPGMWPRSTVARAHSFPPLRERERREGGVAQAQRKGQGGEGERERGRSRESLAPRQQPSRDRVTQCRFFQSARVVCNFEVSCVSWTIFFHRTESQNFNSTPFSSARFKPCYLHFRDGNLHWARRTHFKLIPRRDKQITFYRNEDKES